MFFEHNFINTLSYRKLQKRIFSAGYGPPELGCKTYTLLYIIGENPQPSWEGRYNSRHLIAGKLATNHKKHTNFNNPI